MVDSDRLSAAFETARCDLLAESSTAGHWIGEFSSSPLATAAAISALTLAERHAPTLRGRFVDEEGECRRGSMIVTSLRWLARQQNPDGGWGDTADGPSNIAATMLVRAAYALTCVPADQPGLLERADAYIKSVGGVRALRRYCSSDPTLAASILANSALAGLVPWRKVPALRPELAGFPQGLRKLFGLVVAARELPAHVAVGQACYAHRRPWSPITRFVRRRALLPSLRTLESMQPAGGGFFESVPLTSFVVMGTAGVEPAAATLVRQGVQFLLDTMRPDGSWPLASNLSTRATALAVNALGPADEALDEHGRLDWLLRAQRSGEMPGGLTEGWSWTARAPELATVEDTAEVLLALAAYLERDIGAERPRLVAAASRGVASLVAAQLESGGWNSFGRDATGWFDRGAADTTAQALRALHAWHATLSLSGTPAVIELDKRIAAAIELGLRFLNARQHADGYWTAGWCGDGLRIADRNPILGTAKVLAAYRDLRHVDLPAARRALDWLVAAKATDGGWGGPTPSDTRCPSRASSIEETAAASETLLSCGQTAAHESAAWAGIGWLIDAVEGNRHEQPAAIGLYFGPLWYDEKVYPLAGCVAVLARAAERFLPRTKTAAAAHAAKT